MSLLKKTLVSVAVATIISAPALAQETEKKGLFEEISPNVATGVIAGVTLVGLAVINDSDSSTVVPTPPAPPADGGDGGDGGDDGDDGDDDSGSDTTTSTASTTSTVATVATTTTSATAATTN